MYDETDYICQEFQAHFSEKRGEPMILYGIGNHTGELLAKFPDYRIVGLMDGKKKEGTLWGKPVLDYADVVRLEVKTIVVVARPAVVGVIYHRISEFCAGNGIAVYDIKGSDLKEVYASLEQDIPYFHQNMRQLREEIDRHRIISFDVFDTLIMRKVLYPADIFAIMEREINKTGKEPFLPFAALRVQAEEQLYKEGKNPVLGEIYDRFQQLSGVSGAYRNELELLEIATEAKFIVPRQEMLELFNGIKGKKEIYLISDMYLPGRIIVQLLEKCGYGGYAGIYVSCEEKAVKNRGLLDRFARRMEKKGYGRRDCLHIGDNYEADVMGARKAGMDAFRIMGARELLESSCYRRLLAPEPGFMDRMAIGLLCERAFHDPFALYGTKGKPRIENVQDFAYLFIAPIVFCFTVWMMRRVCRSGCDYVLYPSRDAYLIEKLCNGICEKQAFEGFPEGEYFYASRRSMLAASIKDDRDIERILEMDFSGSIGQLFERRFQVSVDPPAWEIKADDGEALAYYAGKYRGEILARSGKERRNYVRYMQGTGIRGSHKIAFIDLVAAGRVQNGLEKLVQDKEIRGFYFLRRIPNVNEIDRDIRVESFFPSKGAFEIDWNVYKYYLFLEIVMTSPEPTFHSVGDDGEMRFMEETRSGEHRRVVAEMQESIKEYAEIFSTLCPDLASASFDEKISDTILGLMDKEYTTLDIPEVSSLVLTDEFLGQAFNIFRG